MFPARWPWRHQSELTEKAWENAVQGPGNLRRKKTGAYYEDTSGKSKELRKLHLKGTSSGDVVASYIQLLLTMDTRKGSVKVQPFYKKMFNLKCYRIATSPGCLTST